GGNDGSIGIRAADICAAVSGSGSGSGASGGAMLTAGGSALCATIDCGVGADNEVDTVDGDAPPPRSPPSMLASLLTTCSTVSCTASSESRVRRSFAFISATSRSTPGDGAAPSAPAAMLLLRISL